MGGTRRNQVGLGVNFTHHGYIIFAAWFTYDFDGSPFWLSVTAAKLWPCFKTCLKAVFSRDNQAPTTNAITALRGVENKPLPVPNFGVLETNAEHPNNLGTR